MSLRARSGLGASAVGLLLLGFSAFSQFVAASYGEAPAPPPVRRDEVAASLRARLTLVEGLPVARLQGTPYEMGEQHGRIFRRQIRFLYREYYEGMVVRAVGRRALAAWAAAAEPYIPAHYREEMRGLAEGCGLSYDAILRVNTMLDRFQTVLCSTVVAGGEATKDGDVYFGRNLDFLGRGMLHRMTIVLVWEPEQGTPVASVTWPGLIGVLSGMNGHGVAGATMMITHGGKARPGVPYPIMYREALARARKTADVYAAIAKAKRTCPNNFMVVDATGAAEVIEFSPDVALRRPAERGRLCSTNFFRSPELEDVGFKLGRGRYDTLTAFLERERGTIDLARIKKALADVATPGFMNVQSMVFLPRRRALCVAKAEKLPAARQPFVYLSPELLFGAPTRAR